MVSEPKIASLQDLATWVAQSSVLFPGLVAFSIGSRSSLKSWLAVQRAPPAPPLAKDEERKIKWKIAVVTVVAVAAIVGLEFYLFAKGNAATIDRFFTYLFAYVFQVALVGLFLEFTQATQWSVHRGAAGILHYRPYNLSKPKSLIALVSATALNVAAFYDAHWACGSALVVAVLVSRLSNTPARTFSLRGGMLTLICAVAFLTVLLGVMTAAFVKIEQKGHNDENQGETSPTDEENPFLEFASPAVMKYITYFTSALYTMMQGVLVAGCFRFDHSNALESSPDTFAPVVLESVEAPAKRCTFLSSGLVLPSSVPSHFAKPYYTVALWSWLIAQIGTAGLLALVLPIPKALVQASLFPLIGFFLSSILLVITLPLTAVVRGEFKKMWTYKEVWVPKTDNGIALDDTNSTQVAGAIEEESLPAYEAARDVKQSHLVAPYEVSDNKA
ncbi:hypothetical protein JCM16303_002551 [Sporobolomyces ruberrimus]